MSPSKSGKRKRNRWRLGLVHTVRCVLACALLLLIPTPKKLEDFAGNSGAPLELAAVSKVFPNVRSLEFDGQHWLASLDRPNSVGKTQLKLIRTLPAASEARGYRGPTEAIIVLGTENNILQVKILQSYDTHEHVAKVAASNAFLQQFVGWRLGDPAIRKRLQDVDGVSGATLTSMAMATGIAARLDLGGDTSTEPISAIFTKDISLEEIQKFLPSAKRLESNTMRTVLNGTGDLLGYAINTGRFVDDESGYQGPSDVLLILDSDNLLMHGVIRESFDNQPYVSYIDEDSYFWSLFNNLLSDPDSPSIVLTEVEGVSGATMSSQAVAASLIRFHQEFYAWQELEQKKQLETTQAASPNPRVRWSGKELGCLIVLLCLPVFTKSGLMRTRWIRRIWLLCVWCIIGAWAGNLISLTLVVGWFSAGVSIHLAIGLFAIVCVAFLTPPTTRGNPYCNHLCPHGAVQQLIRPTKANRRHITIPSRVRKNLLWIPGFVLVTSYVLIQVTPALDLSFIEPFHAYAWSVASLTSICFAILTICVSAFIPMAYCQFGCPTGSLLEHLRLSSRKEAFTRADGVAFLLLGFALLNWAFQT